MKHSVEKTVLPTHKDYRTFRHCLVAPYSRAVHVEAWIFRGVPADPSWGPHPGLSHNPEFYRVPRLSELLASLKMKCLALA